MSRLSSPAMASALSRTNSASSRRGDCEASSRLPGSTSRSSGRSRRILPIGRRHHQQLDHPLDVPAAVPELEGQPVEQLGMDRPLALRAEVLDQAADARAEELLPEPVHEHPCRERILRRREPPRQVEPGQPSPSASAAAAGSAAPRARPPPPLWSCQLPRGRTRVTSGGMAFVDHRVGPAVAAFPQLEAERPELAPGRRVASRAEQVELGELLDLRGRSLLAGLAASACAVRRRASGRPAGSKPKGETRQPDAARLICR